VNTNVDTHDAVERLADSLQAIQRYLRRHQGARAGQQALTRVQWMILRQLARSGETTIGQLAEQLDVRPSTMSQMLDRLELTGLVVRRPDIRDGRSRIVRLTTAGEQAVRTLRDVRLKLLEGPFQQLTDEEQTALVNLLGKLASLLPKGGADS
jgi:DNA-binding MarR family transcriptional regulator